MVGTNLVGPFGTGVNQTYVEPAFPDSGDTQFSWFVDCSDDTTPDGTKWMANWANRMMQQVRRAVVGMGITPTETDGDALQKAIMRAHRPIVNIGGGIGIHKGEKMPEWQHELRSLEGAGTVSINIVGDKIVITGAAGSSVTLQSLGTGVPVYKGVSGSVHQFRSLMAEAGIAVVQGTNDATFRLAPIPGWSLLLRNGASADVPAAVAIDELTEEASPVGDDWLMLQRNPGRQLRKVKVSKLRGKVLYNQGTIVLGIDTAPGTAVMSGTIPSAGGPCTIAFQCQLRPVTDADELSPALFEAQLQADIGSGFADVPGASAIVSISASGSSSIGIIMRFSIPLVGQLVDAPGAVNWRLNTTDILGSQSTVTWLQFA